MPQLIKDMQRKPCQDCGCEVGAIHMLGCDMERCPKCKMQLIGCNCFTSRQFNSGDAYKEKIGGYQREKWSGIGYEREMKYAEDHNLWSFFQKGKGWVKCDYAHPLATHDINSAIMKLMENK